MTITCDYFLLHTCSYKRREKQNEPVKWKSMS